MATIRIQLFILAVVLFSCTKIQDEVYTVKDIDGNSYPIVTIGTQVWMAENLKTTTYNNGDPISFSEAYSDEIPNDNTSKYQWSNCDNRNDDDFYLSHYGRLYTWYAVTDSRKVCPANWHLPTYEEWQTLIDFLGGENVAGDKLKDCHDWRPTPDGNFENNISGFSALGGDRRVYLGGNNYVTEYGFWWSFTECSATSAWSVMLVAMSSKVWMDHREKNWGISVRCIKNR